MEPCPRCGADEWAEVEYDARGIPLGYACRRCRKELRARYRPEVLSDPNYEADEPIEPEEVP